MFRLVLALSIIAFVTPLIAAKDKKIKKSGARDPALATFATNASRPGDESLSCDALQDELVATANSPALQAYVAESSAEAQKQVKATSDAKAQVGVQAAISAFSSLVPGGSWASVMAPGCKFPYSGRKLRRTSRNTGSG